MSSAIAVFSALMSLGACASPTLEIGYPDAAANRALLASATPRRVVVPAVTDRRTDTSRIGSTPEDGKPIVTARAVPDIVRDALVLELQKNGHEVVAAGGDVVLRAEVDEFWLGTIGRSGDTRYLGRVAVAIVVDDGRTGDRLLTRHYIGISRRTGAADSKERWGETMDTALARAIHDIATDPDLVSSVLGRGRV